MLFVLRLLQERHSFGFQFIVISKSCSWDPETHDLKMSRDGRISLFLTKMPKPKLDRKISFRVCKELKY